ncbi:hypothetical protein D3C75_694430 [compost metagenome]
MRIARPVTDLGRSSEMYCSGLGFKTIGHFINHSGFSGIMLGRSDLPWHIEFTHCLTHAVTPTQTIDDLLVLYYSERSDWNHACQQMYDAGFSTVKSFNPYWDVSGRTFTDMDGYRTVMQYQRWKNM